MRSVRAGQVVAPLARLAVALLAETMFAATPASKDWSSRPSGVSEWEMAAPPSGRRPDSRQLRIN